MSQLIFCIAVNATRIGIAIHHVVVVSGYDNHYKSADKQTCKTAERTGMQQIGISGNYK